MSRICICSLILAIMCPFFLLSQEIHTGDCLYNKLNESNINQSSTKSIHYYIQNTDGNNILFIEIAFFDEKLGSEQTVRYSMETPVGAKRVKLSENYAVVYYQFHNYIMLEYPEREQWLADSHNPDNHFKYKSVRIADEKHFSPNGEPTRIRYSRSEFILKGNGSMVVYISVRKRDICQYLKPFIGRENAQRFEQSEKSDKWWK